MFNLNIISVTKQPLPARHEDRELTLADLDAAAGGGTSKASGGRLSASCCTGKHFSEATLYVR